MTTDQKSRATGRSRQSGRQFRTVDPSTRNNLKEEKLKEHLEKLAKKMIELNGKVTAAFK